MKKKITQLIFRYEDWQYLLSRFHRVLSLVMLMCMKLLDLIKIKMKHVPVLSLVVGLCIALSNALTPSTYMTKTDTLRLQKVFSNALPPVDLASAHYATLGFSLLGEKIPDAEGLCRFLNSKVDKQLESVFYASSASKNLGSCKLTATGLQELLQAVLNPDSSLQDIYYAVLSMKNLNYIVDSTKVSKLLVAALKRDDSVLNLGYAFHVASKLQGDLTPFFERIEDVIVQADEVDGKYLQFEGGLGITSTTISGVYRLAEVVKKAPALTADQAVKFTNYFLSRKFVQTVKGAAVLLDILKIFSSNKFHIPVAMTLASSSAVSIKNPSIQIRITDVLGRTLGPLTITADSAVRLGDETVILSKKVFQAVKGSDVLYSLNFIENKPLRGFYKLSISAIPTKPDPRLVGNTAAEIHIKMMTEATIDGVEIGTIDRDQATSAKSTTLKYPEQLKSALEADFHQKLFMKFALKDNSAKTSIAAHQTFVQFVSRENNQEIVFVAELDSTNVYRFDLDVYAKAKEFNYASMDYDINVIVGDAVIMNPFTWKIGQVHLSFPAQSQPSKPAENPYEPKPEIKHLFREQEKRPSTLVSNTFSVLVIMPLFLLFILWFKIRANIYNFPCSLSALGFHAGLAAIFCLFACFWLHLNMFSTLKYLSGLSVLTFLCGHRVLSKMSQYGKI